MSAEVAAARGRAHLGLGRLAAAILFLGVFFIPLGALPFGPSVSLFELLSGTLSKSAWSPARLLLLVGFATSVVFFGLSMLRFVRAKHGSAA